MPFFVDIPQTPEFCGRMKHIDTFNTRQEAVAFCKEQWGTDENGMVGLVSFVQDYLSALCRITRRVRTMSNTGKYFLTTLDNGRQWLTDGKDFGVDPDAVPELLIACLMMERALQDYYDDDGDTLTLADCVFDLRVNGQDLPGLVAAAIAKTGKKDK